MDWSILRFKSDGKFPFLRPELVYTESIPVGGCRLPNPADVNLYINNSSITSP